MALLNKGNMHCEDKDSDLEEDEELASLRLAALATLKTSKTENDEKDQPDSRPKLPHINDALPAATGLPHCIKHDQSSTPPFTNQYQQNHSAHQLRRNRGIPFPKINQRSNLIVITPINLDETNTFEKNETLKKYNPTERKSTTQLVLPQHKWCQPTNEDSSSPKTYRRTGPTRFNRHESRSDSSDSDYENSDNDSYSNETILQDEPSEHFSCMTPDESVDSISMCKDRRSAENRLCFKNIDPDSPLSKLTHEKTGAYNSVKSSFSRMITNEQGNSVKSLPAQNASDPHSGYGNHDLQNRSLVDKHFTRGCSESSSAIFDERSASVNGDFCPKSDYFPEKDYIASYSRNFTTTQAASFESNSIARQSVNNAKNLPPKDLRFELRKKKQATSTYRANSPVKPDSFFDHHLLGQNRDYGCKSNEKENSEHTYRSRERFARSRSFDRSRSPTPNHRHTSISPSKNNSSNLDRKDKQSSRRMSTRRDRSQSPNGGWKKNSPHSDQEHTSSSHKGFRQRRSRSPDRNDNQDLFPSSKRGYSHSSSDRIGRQKPKYNSSAHDCNDDPTNRRDYKTAGQGNDKSDRPYHSYSSSRNGQRDNFSRQDHSTGEMHRRDHKQRQDYSCNPDRTGKRSCSLERKRDQSFSPRKGQEKDGSTSELNRKHYQKHGLNETLKKEPASEENQQCRNKSSFDSRNKPIQQSLVQDRKRRRYSRSSSSSSSSSTSDSSNSSNNSDSPVCSVPSVVTLVSKAPDVKPQNLASCSKEDLATSSESGFIALPKRDSEENHKVSLSNLKSSIYVGESRNNVSDSCKRVPVHMRLGTLPRKRVIQMTKDVEAAFVNTSSDDDNDSNLKNKKQNFSVTKVYRSEPADHSKESFVQNTFKSREELVGKERKMKIHR